MSIRKNKVKAKKKTKSFNSFYWKKEKENLSFLKSVTDVFNSHQSFMLNIHKK
jgi:hypothetical protein